MKCGVYFAAVLMLAAVASAATIQIDPISSNIFMGDAGDVNVRVTDVDDLYAYQFDVAFDPAILSATSVIEGTFLSDVSGTFFIPGVIDNTVGTITFTANTLLGPIAGVSGSGTLATIRLQSLSIGTSAITLSNTLLLNSALGNISAEVQDGSVAVVIIPEPNSGLLLVSVIVLGLFGRYRRMHCRCGRGAHFAWLAILPLSVPAMSAQQVAIIEHPLPTTGSGPRGITAGPDGALWFTEFESNKIGRITTAGVITEYPVPTVGSGPWGITAGPDGALWFTEYGADKIGRITTAGVVTEYPTAGGLIGITAGPDGALWFTEYYSNKIGRITTAGVITEYPVPTNNGSPWEITAGPDGALWCTEFETDKTGIGRITTAGVITEYPVAEYNHMGIAAGPDGALWCTQWVVGKIRRITTAGVITEYPVPQPAVGITAGPDGALWFTEYHANKIGRITTAGVITEYPVPTAGSGPWGITAGPDGALWFTESGGNKIGQVVLGPPDLTKPISHVSPLPGKAYLANFPVQWSGTDAGFGILDFTIYVSDNGGPFHVWLLKTPASEGIFASIAGHTYGFYSIARDGNGNQEDPKLAAEATTQVSGDRNADDRVDCADLAIVKASFGKRAGQPGFDSRADVNLDGVVDVRDLSWVSQDVPPDMKCP